MYEDLQAKVRSSEYEYNKANNFYLFENNANFIDLKADSPFMRNVKQTSF